MLFLQSVLSSERKNVLVAMRFVFRKEKKNFLALPFVFREEKFWLHCVMSSEKTKVLL